jgi:hypothetical protein
MNGVSSRCTYRWALDRITKLYDGCVERLRRWLTEQAPRPWSANTAPNPKSDLLLFRALAQSSQPHILTVKYPRLYDVRLAGSSRIIRI